MKPIWIAAALLLPGINAPAAKPTVKPTVKPAAKAAPKPSAKPAAKPVGLPLEKLTRQSPLIFLARCPRPTTGCLNDDKKLLIFHKVRTLKGNVEPMGGMIAIPVKQKAKPPISEAYRPSVTLEQSGRTDLILFLTPAEKNAFRFTAPSSYESGEKIAEVTTILLKSSK